MNDIVKIGSIYTHYKGNKYEVLNIAEHSETNEKLVIYRSLKNNKVWARPYSMFTEYVSKGNVCLPRFNLSDENGEGYNE